jgi:V/A-type H+-transporting ATPase subunit G/H
MSGIETIKIIVDSEREAAKMLADADVKALEIRKRLDSLIQTQRNDALNAAKKEAAALVQKAENEGKAESQEYEKDAENKIRTVVSRASAKKREAVEKLVALILEMKA